MFEPTWRRRRKSRGKQSKSTRLAWFTRRKKNYARSLTLEPLERRDLLTVVARILGDDLVVKDAVAGFNTIEERNDVTLSIVENAGNFFVRVFDPDGVQNGGGGVVINANTVDFNVNNIDGKVFVDLQDDDDILTINGGLASPNRVLTADLTGGSPGIGSDSLHLIGNAAVAETIDIRRSQSIINGVFRSDEQIIDGFGVPTGGPSNARINLRGFELINYIGGERDDPLNNDIFVARMEEGRTTARLQNATPSDFDLLISNVLPNIEFRGLALFRLDGSLDPVEATFVTNELEGAAAYEFLSQAEDTLVIEGTDGDDDDYTLTVPAANQVRIVDNSTRLLNPVVVTATGTFSRASGDRVQFNTLGGDDLVRINVEGTTLVDAPITFDGGLGADTLLVVGTPSVAVTSVNYQPGPQVHQGRINYDTVGIDMTIDFLNLEPVIDLVPAAVLIVNGTNEANVINYVAAPVAGRGRVAVDGFELIDFANKVSLQIEGQASDDIITLNNIAQPTGLLNIVVNAAGGNDEIRIEGLPAAGGTFTGATINGGDGNDIVDGSLNPNNTFLTINGNAGSDRITGGFGNDLIDAGTGDDTIVVTRGNDVIDAGDGADTYLLLGTAASDTVLITQTIAANVFNIDINGSGGTKTTSNFESFRIETQAGNDSVTLAFPNPLLITIPIFYDGGPGSDSLTVNGNFDGGSIDTVNYTPGLQNDEGRILYTDAGTTMDISFDNLEPIFDLVAAATLIINGTPAANSITYRQGSAANRGLVAIDDFETYEFNDKTNVIINAGGGNDEVVLDNPNRPLGLQNLTVNGDQGDDSIIAVNMADQATGFVRATLNGGVGNDTLDARDVTQITRFTLNGDAGNDFLAGGPARDIYSGGTGDDILVDSPASDDYDGGTGNDTLRVDGTLNPDVITIVQTGVNTLEINLNGVATTENVTNIDLVRVEAGDGDDLIGISQSDLLITPGPPDTDNGSLAFRVIGGSPNASDRLIVRDDGAGDLVIQHQAADRQSGSFRVGPLKPIDYEGIEFAEVTPVDPLTGNTGDAFDGRWIVFRHDPFENNNTRFIANSLGPNPQHIGDLNIFPGPTELPPPFGSIPGDHDWFEFRPNKIGTYRFEVLFDQIAALASGRQGLPGAGDLDIEIYTLDALGNPVFIATSNSIDDNESLDISMAANKRYYVRIFGFEDAINVYDLNIIEVDVLGPQVTDIEITGFPDFDLFDPKPSAPTPLIDSLTIHFRDLLTALLSRRAPGDVYPALDELVAAQPGLYQLVGERVGLIPIASVTVNNAPTTIDSTVTTEISALTFVAAGLVGAADQPVVGDSIIFTNGGEAGQIRTITAYDAATGQITVDEPFTGNPAVGDDFTILKIATATVTLTFAEPLPDDRYTFTILDGVTDPPGNKLDGEFGGIFPSGNFISGGNFVIRFVVDSRPEIGVWSAGTVLIDANGNFLMDPAYSLGDLAFDLGFSSDYIFAGNFRNGAVADGFDKLAAYGRVGNSWRWLIDTNNDGVPDIVKIDPLGINGIPVAGNFDGNAANGDEVGVFTGTEWWFDTNGDFLLDSRIPGGTTGYRGFPIAGDFDGDGDDDVGTYVASSQNSFFIDLNTAGAGSRIAIDGVADFSFRVGTAGNGFYGFPGVRERPVAADMNRDGYDDIGLWAPDGSALVPGELGEWFFFLSGDIPSTPVVETSILTRIEGGVIRFRPEPFANDLYAQFGNSFALPVVGNFDPPGPGLPASVAPFSQASTAAPVSTAVYATAPPLSKAKPQAGTAASAVFSAVQTSVINSVEEETALPAAPEANPVASSAPPVVANPISKTAASAASVPSIATTATVTTTTTPTKSKSAAVPVVKPAAIVTTSIAPSSTKSKSSKPTAAVSTPAVSTVAAPAVVETVAKQAAVLSAPRVETRTGTDEAELVPKSASKSAAISATSEAATTEVAAVEVIELPTTVAAAAESVPSDTAPAEPSAVAVVVDVIAATECDVELPAAEPEATSEVVLVVAPVATIEVICTPAPAVEAAAIAAAPETVAQPVVEQVTPQVAAATSVEVAKVSAKVAKAASASPKAAPAKITPAVADAAISTLKVSRPKATVPAPSLAAIIASLPSSQSSSAQKTAAAKAKLAQEKAWALLARI